MGPYSLYQLSTEETRSSEAECYTASEYISTQESCRSRVRYADKNKELRSQQWRLLYVEYLQDHYPAEAFGHAGNPTPGMETYPETDWYIILTLLTLPAN